MTMRQFINKKIGTSIVLNKMQIYFPAATNYEVFVHTTNFSVS